MCTRAFCNRISLGVQSFQRSHLLTLTRDHSPQQARRSVQDVLEMFDAVNVDLIYGIPHQSHEDFLQDLQTAVSLGVEALSLYLLTFEPQTPMGRSWQRGKISQSAVDEEAGFYGCAREYLQQHCFLHHEVSHFSRPRQLSTYDHNTLYWRMQPYVGVGAGAHGYYIFDRVDPVAMRRDEQGRDEDRRYFYPRAHQGLEILHHVPESVEEFWHVSGAMIDVRDEQAYLLEYIATSLRTSQGVPMQRLYDLGYAFCPQPTLRALMDEGQIWWQGDRLCFDARLWIYEHCYVHELWESLVPVAEGMSTKSASS